MGSQLRAQSNADCQGNGSVYPMAEGPRENMNDRTGERHDGKNKMGSSRSHMNREVQKITENRNMDDTPSNPQEA